jgi:hypothetical protein
LDIGNGEDQEEGKGREIEQAEEPGIAPRARPGRDG